MNNITRKIKRYMALALLLAAVTSAGNSAAVEDGAAHIAEPAAYLVAAGDDACAAEPAASVIAARGNAA